MTRFFIFLNVRTQKKGPPNVVADEMAEEIIEKAREKNRSAA